MKILQNSIRIYRTLCRATLDTEVIEENKSICLSLVCLSRAPPRGVWGPGGLRPLTGAPESSGETSSRSS